MLYILFDRDLSGMTEEKAVELFGKPILEFPEEEFDDLVSHNPMEVVFDERFKKIVSTIDNAKVEPIGVITDNYTGISHNVYDISGGAKTLWLAQIGFNVTFLSQWFGPNCYQTLFDISKDVDVYLYDDSDMFWQDNIECIKGDFVDFLSGDTIHWDGDKSFDILMERRRI